jgi:hypothetical protein
MESSKYIMAVVSSKLDVILILNNNYCVKCCENKVGYILKIYNVEIEEVKILNKLQKWKVYNILCDCNKI